MNSKHFRKQINSGNLKLRPMKNDLKKRKTRFPMARIKRIMQSDEEIGKVSTSAPVVLSKAIELFIKDLVTECSKEGKGKIGAAEIMNLIKNTEKYNFLIGKLENTE